MNNTGMKNAGMTPQPAPGITGPVLLVVAGGTVSQAAIARTAELAAGAPVTVVGVRSEKSRTDSASSRPLNSPPPPHQAHQLVSPSPRAGTAGGSGASSPRDSASPEQVRRTVALAMSILEDTGVMATGHVAVTGSPGRAVARMARACGARVVILDQSGPSVGGHPVHPGVSWTGASRGSTGRDGAGRDGAGRDGAGRDGAGRGGAGTAGLMAELRRRMYGSGIVVLAETARRGGWLSA